MRVVLIGAGNVAYQLGSLIQKGGHEIIQLYNRSKPAATRLSKLLACAFTTSIPSINGTADLYIVAINDDAIGDFTSRLLFKPRLIVHTSGSCSMNVFPSSFNCGVLYPVQTFSRNINRTPDRIPFCIEARNEQGLRTIKSLVKTLNQPCYVIDSFSREKIHLAAVMVNNFSNHLFTLSEQFLEKERLPFGILIPLINETSEKLKYSRPDKIQTGPAVRGDKAIIKKHLHLLARQTELKKLYELFTKSIVNTYDK
jgi:predicted short-subunit dehydrogenase-like oxidoreductase (DUF2520 family)